MAMKLVSRTDSVLLQKAAEVTEFGAELRSLVSEMLETLEAVKRDRRGALALAAPQVGVSLRIFVMKMPCAAPRVVINPRITWKSCKTQLNTEGCLSFPPKFTELVTRPDKIELDFVDIRGTPISIAVRGLESACIQHEIDHLDGVLIGSGDEV